MNLAPTTELLQRRYLETYYQTGIIYRFKLPLNGRPTPLVFAPAPLLLLRLDAFNFAA